MAEVMQDLGIQEILAQFEIEEINNGASLGSKWFKTRGERIDSYSPVDGKLIASVNSATAKSSLKVRPHPVIGRTMAVAWKVPVANALCLR